MPDCFAHFLWVLIFQIFFLPGFPFTTIHELQDCRGRGRAFLLTLPPASQTLRHQPGDFGRELTSAHRQQLDQNWELLVSEHKSLTTKLRALKKTFLTVFYNDKKKRQIRISNTNFFFVHSRIKITQKIIQSQYLVHLLSQSV